MEKLVAKRIADKVNRFNLVDFHQFGGRPCSSVTDAALTFTNIVRHNHRNQMDTAALAVDIKGFFDNIQHHRL
jgi:hypothetical protein